MKILKFSATWCGPCKMLSKTLEGYTDVEIKEIDIDVDRTLTEKYGIRGVPTLVLLDDNGVELRRRSGMMMFNEFEKFVQGQ